MSWQSIETAPRDGTWVQAKIPSHGSDNIIAWDEGFLNSSGEDVFCWVFPTDQEPPDCWIDGVCWEENEDGVKSIEPTHWKSLPS